MNDLHHAIISPTWVWLWYYGEYNTKHLMELHGNEAEEWIKTNRI